MSKSQVFAAALLTLMSGAATAQSSPQSLANAYERAASARLSVRAVSAEVDIARARVGQARAAFYPTVDLVTNTDVIKSYDTFTGTTATVEIPQLNIKSTVKVTQSVPRYQTVIGLQLQQQVYDGGRSRAQFNRQELALQAAELSRQLVLQEVALDVSNAYFRLRRACLQTESGMRRVARAQELASTAAQRLQEGRIAIIERSATDLALVERTAALRASADELEIAQVELAATQNDTALNGTPAGQHCVFATDVATDLAYAMRLADDTLEARQQGLRAAAAGQAVEVERAALRPQLSLNARYTGGARSDNSVSDGLFNNSRRQARIGLQLSFNLFDGDLARQRVAETESERQRLGFVAERVAGEREQASRRAAIKLRMAGSRLELLRARVAMAREQSALARQRMANGTGTSTVAEEQADRERDAQDELRLAELDQAMSRLAAAFPTVRASASTFQSAQSP